MVEKRFCGLVSVPNVLAAGTDFQRGGRCLSATPILVERDAAQPLVLPIGHEAVEDFEASQVIPTPGCHENLKNDVELTLNTPARAPKNLRRFVSVLL